MGPRGQYVYVVNADGTASMRQIKEGQAEGSDVQIVSGLAPGAMVITDGQDKLQEGSKVQARSADGGTGGPPAQTR